jgi:hypothetical protein
LGKDSSDVFGRWLKSESSPIELLILGSFRYLGRGLAFDNLEEYTGISEDLQHCFFHAFIKFGSTKLFKEYVIAPNDSNQEEAAHQHEYNIAGCHGAIDSTDAVHICLKEYPTSYAISTLVSKCRILLVRTM